MSGFHPLLGLLAVAVCISYSEGAPFPGIQKEDLTAHKLHNADFRTSLRSARDAGPMPSAFHNKKKIAKRDDSQDTNAIDDRNSENIIQTARLAKLKDLRTRDDHDILNKAKVEQSASGALEGDSRESSGLLAKSKQSESEESSSGSDGSETVPSKEGDGSDVSLLSGSQLEEECEDDENTGSTSHPEDGEGSSTLSPPSSVSEDATEEGTITSNPTSPPKNEDEECEENEPKRTTPPTTTTTTTTTTTETEPESESSNSEPVESSEESQESQESEECEDSVSPTPTQPSRRTTTPKKKPRDPDQSSGSFNDSDPDGVDFSDSYSKESNGRSTELSDK